MHKGFIITRILLILILFIFASTSYLWADPAPLGLEIGKATIKEAKEKYKLSYVGINQYTEGEMYNVDAYQIEMKYLKNCSLIFDKNSKLVAVLMTFSKSGSGRNNPEFQYYFNLLKERYKLVRSDIPFVGDSYARFVDGNTEIILEAPHLSFTMTLTYIKKDTLNSMNEQIKREKSEEKSKTKKNL